MAHQVMDILPFENSHAFLIAINTYNNGISSLETPIRDAKEIGKLLSEKHGYTIHESYDSTLHEIRAMFKKMQKLVQEKDRVIIYFAGHGIAKDSEKDPEGYLIPSDATKKGTDSLVGMDELHETINKLPCKHGLLILDCCFAGSFKWSTGTRSFTFDPDDVLYAERFLRFVKHPAWQVITSSAHDQKAADLLTHEALGLREYPGDESIAAGKNSPFAWALKEAIDLKAAADVKRGGRSDGVITATELYNYLRDIVETETRKAGNGQSPAFFSLQKHDSKGEFIFIHPGRSFSLPNAPNSNPYKGLNSFLEPDAPAFFGREEEIEQMANRLTKNPLLLISAPSGQGKSSIVKAGLFPYLRKKYPRAHFHIIRPGAKPEAGLQTLTNIDNKRLNYLLLDQYEEFFTDAKYGEGHQRFEKALLERLPFNSKSNLRLLITIRSDFEWELKYSEFGRGFWPEDDSNIKSFLYRLPPMSLDSLRKIVVNPARLVAYDFESEEMVDEILAEINNSPGVLPLLSFALYKLFEEEKKLELEGIKPPGMDRVLTLHTYEKILGGVNGAFSKHADDVYHKMTQAQQDFAQKLILRMVRLNDGNYSRRRVYLEVPSRLSKTGIIDELDYPGHLDETKEKILEVLEEASLIAYGEDELGSFVEPTHDSLINFWPKCLGWIRAFGRENLILQRQLWQATVEYHQWEPEGSDSVSTAESLLWDHNPKLQQVQISVLDPEDKWLFKSRKKTKSLAAFAFLIWETELNELQLANLDAFETFFDASNSRDRFFQIRRQMDNWLNENELAFIRHSFEVQRSEIEQLTQERDEAQAAALAAQARQMEKKDPTIAYNMAFAAYKTHVSTLTSDVITDQWLNRDLTYKMVYPHLDYVTAFVISADGKHILLGMENGEIQLVDLNNGTVLNTYEGHTDSIIALSFASEEQFFSCSDDNKVKQWNILDGAILNVFSLSEFEDEVFAASFSPDGRYLVTDGEGNQGFIWDLQSGEFIRHLIGHAGPIHAIAVSPDSKTILTGSWDNTAKLWDLESGVEKCRLVGHTKKIISVAFSNDSRRVITGSEDNTAKVWNIHADDISGYGMEMCTLEGHLTKVEAVSIAPDGKHALTGASDSSLKLWDIQVANETKKGKEIKDFLGHTAAVKRIGFLPDGKHILSTSRDQTSKKWVFNLQPEIQKFVGHLGAISRVEFAPNGEYMVSSSLDATAKLWSVETGEMLQDFSGHLGGILSLSFSPSGKYIITGSRDGTARIWETISGREIDSYEHYKDIESCVFSPDERSILIGSNDGVVINWDLKSKREITRYIGHNGAVYSLDFSADGQYVITGGKDRKAIIWEASNGLKHKVFGGHLDIIYEVAFLPDGKSVITGSFDESVRIWDIESGQIYKRIYMPGKKVETLTFSPDGKFLLVGCRNGKAGLLDIHTGLEVRSFHGHKSNVHSVAFSPDSKNILTGSHDQTVKLWDASMDWNNNIYKLSAKERTKFGINLDY